jgi:hypothetical protein
MNLGLLNSMDERVDEIEYATIFVFNLNFLGHFLDNFLPDTMVMKMVDVNC